MDRRKLFGYFIFLLGLVIFCVSAFADMMKIGNAPGFGAYQWIGSIIGAILVVFGSTLIFKKK